MRDEERMNELLAESLERFENGEDDYLDDVKAKLDGWKSKFEIASEHIEEGHLIREYDYEDEKFKVDLRVEIWYSDFAEVFITYNINYRGKKYQSSFSGWNPYQALMELKDEIEDFDSLLSLL